MSFTVLKKGVVVHTEVEDELLKRQDIIELAKSHLEKARERMKRTTDRKRSDVEFGVDDGVFVKLRPYKQISMAHRLNHKL